MLHFPHERSSDGYHTSPMNKKTLSLMAKVGAVAGLVLFVAPMVSFAAIPVYNASTTEANLSPVFQTLYDAINWLLTQVTSNILWIILTLAVVGIIFGLIMRARRHSS